MMGSLRAASGRFARGTVLFGPSNPDDGFVEGQHPVAALAVLYSSDGLKPDDGFVEGASGRCARGTVLFGHRLNHD